ncbi:MFS transporter [Vibrio tubiashii]|uniref:MFS transporter n=1 Tax=Vibrio tubiashii ATCC 19109 TaxID=1051646 RepID=F9TBT5_9VIBR|nr:MFS transporter [Vibrio tubiashii]AIW17274.1 hypothetical protein IX91_24685 [Vibrio tubiashii ATCC 19109]EGU48637.1 hypothetical protein VITU9109_04642 [Vibrio tubiashii ATCC 19109]EIF04961.1 hypothetical protein VT1337_05624 [Vibrio tubiashii NCIMB 1337 = ATCC 19106]
MLVEGGVSPSSRVSTRSLMYVLCTFLFAVGSYILTPFFAIYVSDSLGFGLAFAGSLITIKIVVQRGLSIVGGALSDQYPSHQVAMLGVAARCFSYLLLAINPTEVTLVLSAVLNGVGSALFHPSVRKLLFLPYKDNDALLQKVIVWRSMSLNTGTAIGPVIGSLLISEHFSAACIAIAAIYACSVVVFIGARAETDDQARPTPMPLSVNTVRQAISLQVLSVLKLQFAFIFLYSHLEYLLPVFVEQTFSTKMVAAMFMVNSFVVILLQSKIAKLALGANAIQLSLVVVFGLLYLASEISDDRFYWAPAALLLGVVVFSVFEIACSFRVDYQLTKVSDDSLSGTVFGCASAIAALAFLLANAVNYWLYEWLGFANLWASYLGVCSLAFLFSYISNKEKF